MPCAPAEMVPRQVRGYGIEPGGKFFARPKTGAGTKNPDKSLLRQIIGVVLVGQHPAKKMEQRRRVPFHQIIQRRILTGDQAFHVGPVAGAGINGVHAGPLRIWTWIARWVRADRG